VAAQASSSPIVSVRVSDQYGQSLSSDVIAACDWVLANKDQYDIGVANLSLVESGVSTFRYNPLDQAVESLWLNGVVVTTAAGNYGVGSEVDTGHAPGNDPFVITVGALDQNGTTSAADDTVAPWSAFGHTADGFWKPELSAPGRYIVAPVPDGSYLAQMEPDRVVAPGSMWMSGTSFSAPMAAGAAADLLALHPDWTPDQVKGALMVSAAALPAAPGFAGGVGEIDAAAADAVADPPNPNANLDAYVSGTQFDADAWNTAVAGASDWSASDWSASDWSASDWSASDWSASDWSASDWSASDWSSSLWRP
jgi:serine protease AprX